MESEASQKETLTGKTLVVYFSATGNTESAANYIAQATGGEKTILTKGRRLWEQN